VLNVKRLIQDLYLLTRGTPTPTQSQPASLSTSSGSSQQQGAASSVPPSPVPGRPTFHPTVQAVRSSGGVTRNNSTPNLSSQSQSSLPQSHTKRLFPSGTWRALALALALVVDCSLSLILTPPLGTVTELLQSPAYLTYTYLLPWGLNAELDKQMEIELGLSPPNPTTTICLRGHKGKLTMMTPQYTRPYSRYSCSPFLTALHSLAAVAYTKALLQIGENKNAFSKILSYFCALLPDSVPRYHHSTLCQSTDEPRTARSFSNANSIVVVRVIDMSSRLSDSSPTFGKTKWTTSRSPRTRSSNRLSIANQPKRVPTLFARYRCGAES